MNQRAWRLEDAVIPSDKMRDGRIYWKAPLKPHLNFVNATVPHQSKQMEILAPATIKGAEGYSLRIALAKLASGRRDLLTLEDVQALATEVYEQVSNDSDLGGRGEGDKVFVRLTARVFELVGVDPGLSGQTINGVDFQTVRLYIKSKDNNRRQAARVSYEKLFGNPAMDSEGEQDSDQPGERSEQLPAKRSKRTSCRGLIKSSDLSSNDSRRTAQLAGRCPGAVLDACGLADPYKHLAELRRVSIPGTVTCVIQELDGRRAYDRGCAVLRAVCTFLKDKPPTKYKEVIDLHREGRVIFLAEAKRLLEDTSINDRPRNQPDRATFEWFLEKLVPSISADSRFFEAPFWALIKLSSAGSATVHGQTYNGLCISSYLATPASSVKTLMKQPNGKWATRVVQSMCSVCPSENQMPIGANTHFQEDDSQQEGQGGQDPANESGSETPILGRDTVTIANNADDVVGVLLALVITWYRFPTNVQPCQTFVGLKTLLLRIFVHSEWPVGKKDSKQILKVWEALKLEKHLPAALSLFGSPPLTAPHSSIALCAVDENSD